MAELILQLCLIVLTFLIPNLLSRNICSDRLIAAVRLSGTFVLISLCLVHLLCQEVRPVTRDEKRFGFIICDWKDAFHILEFAVVFER